MISQPRIAQIKISELSKDGFGCGDWISPNGVSHKIEVPFSMPKDEVLVELQKRRKGVKQAKVLEWTQLSEDRAIPKCIHFESCGGCRWQHIHYADQLKLKEAWILQLLSPLTDSHTTWYPILSCLPPWEYRNKMELTFSSDKQGNRYLGLILQGTRGHVFQMKECHLMSSWIIKAVDSISQWWVDSGLQAYHGGADKGSLRTLTLREGQRTGDKMVMLTVSGNPDYALNKKQLQDFVTVIRKSIESDLSDQKLSIFLRIQQIQKGIPTEFFEIHLYGPDHIREILQIETKKGEFRSLEFHISPTAFFQPNTRQAENLYSRAIQMTEIPENAVIYDLYCGTGTLGICMAHVAKKIIGIELSPESSLDARENVKRNQIKNVTIHTGDVGRILPTLEEGEMPDVVLVDPPRAGLGVKAVEGLLKIKAPNLTYISCNPKSQAADLDLLIKGGYRIKAIQPVDQFPQTIHVENIVVLEKC